MVAWLLRGLVLCLTGSMLLCAAMIALGRTQPPHPALSGFSAGCEDAVGICWHGIIPGETSLTRARTVMQQLGYQIETGNLYAVNVDMRQDVYLHAESQGCGIISLIYTVSFADPRITIGTYQQLCRTHARRCHRRVRHTQRRRLRQPARAAGVRQPRHRRILRHAYAIYASVERLWISLVGGVSYGEWHGFPRALGLSIGFGFSLAGGRTAAVVYRMMPLAALLITVFTLSGALMIVLGSILPVRPALREFIDGCAGAETFCWHGVISGQTTTREAAAVLQQAGFHVALTNSYDIYSLASSAGCRSAYLLAAQETAMLAHLEDCHDIAVYDVITLFGTPQFVVFRASDGDLIFHNGFRVTFGGRLSGFAPITAIWRAFDPNIGYVFGWLGMQPFWRYCQLSGSGVETIVSIVPNDISC
ncbi:MAG: hypothetical protein U0694_04570 [Anaerolineae bacterium]